MSQLLPGLVESAFEGFTLHGLDDLLSELAGVPREPGVAGLIDDLLDYRVVLAERIAGGRGIDGPAGTTSVGPA